MEGPTNFDAQFKVGGRNVFVEANLTSDISVDTMHCANRNQIARRIDVGLWSISNDVEEYFFVMLTPERYQQAVARAVLRGFTVVLKHDFIKKQIRDSRR